MGAWIEIFLTVSAYYLCIVAPVWGRGLKYAEIQQKGLKLCRSRVGAWIEISEFVVPIRMHWSLPCGGVD